MTNEYIIDYEIYDGITLIGWGNTEGSTGYNVTAEGLAQTIREKVSKEWKVKSNQVRIIGVFKL